MPDSPRMFTSDADESTTSASNARANAAEATPAGKLRVFISYSRADSEFADELQAGLERSGFEVAIDRHSIEAGDDWRKRLGDLILGTDTVIFVLSPDSANSDICEWEVGRAVDLSKRILPVVCRPVDFSGKVPLRLKELNAIPMDGVRAISGLARLNDALKSDLEWLKRHTRIAEMAEEWHRTGRSEDRLLLGSALKEARHWLENKPRDAPEPTLLQRQFVAASDEWDDNRAKNDALLKELLAERAARQAAQQRADTEQVAKESALRQTALAESRRRRILTAAVAGLSVMALSAGWQWQQAEAQRREAEVQRQEAVAQRNIAETRRQLAEDQRRAEESQRAIAGQAVGLQDLNFRLCSEAVKVTAALGTGIDIAKWDADFALFWTLYFGPMIGLETLEREASGNGRSAVAEAMVAFGTALGGQQSQVEDARRSGLPRQDLITFSDKVADACRRFTNPSAL